MSSKRNKKSSTKTKTIFVTILLDIASVMILAAFALLFFSLFKNDEQYMMEHHIDATCSILVFSGLIITMIAGNILEYIKSEELKRSIIKIYTSRNSIMDVIKYASEENIPLNLVYEVLYDFDSSLFQQK